MNAAHDHEDELSEGLRAFVDAARAVPPPVVKVDAETIRTEWLRRRERRRAWVVGGLAAAAMLVVIGGSAVRSWTDRASDGAVDSSASVAARDVAKSVDEQPKPVEQARTSASPAVDDTARPDAPRVALASGVAVQSRAGSVAGLDVVDTHRLRLTGGDWSVTSDVSEPVTVDLPDGHLVIHGGSAHVQIAGDHATVVVTRSEVLRFDAQGTAVELADPSVAPVEAAPRAVLQPDDLAAKAEAHLAAGRRSKAISTLQRLVTRHPRSTAAAAGLLDLGRLLERAGQVDRARCAYALFITRWPGHALAGDVARAKAKLGAGPSCRGLRPAR